MGCNKFILFGLNFIVFVVGAAVVGLASFVISKTHDYTPLLEDGVLTLPVIVLIIGLILGLIGFFGCCGALKENSCMLYTYAVIVIVLLISQLTVGILFLIYQDEAKQTARDAMTKVFENYNNGNDESLDQTIDSMQADLQCCGVNGYEDWFNILGGKDVTKGCCRKKTDVDNCYKDVKSDQESIYTRGCYKALEDEVMKVSYGLGITAIVLTIVQLACIMIACGLGKRAGRRGEYA